MKYAQVYKAGLDIGSTTAKIVLIDENGKLIFSDYQRHHARIYQAAKSFLLQIQDMDKDCCLDLKLTGSAALDTSEKLDLPFVQEVIATHAVIKKKYSDVRTAIDIGGEDSKMIFFETDRPPDIRMNGSCAGGTGSFIDQMATLLGITPFQLNDLAAAHEHIYPVASRCGVFAKTDVQNMLSRNISHSDIAASIFHAVAIQCMNSLARGREVESKILLCGGVFSFLPELVKRFSAVLGFSEKDLILPDRSELVPATGAALFDKVESDPIPVSRLLQMLDKGLGTTGPIKDRMQPLFKNDDHFQEWKKQSSIIEIPSNTLKEYSGNKSFLGIDSGSTTTKIVLLGENKEVLFSWYHSNAGNPVKTVIKGLNALKQEISDAGSDIEISRTAVTGYGEDLIRIALNLDEGIVETLAHKEAASFIDPDVSFILDIGGQDMKAIFIENGVINRIEVNEACSSGCGSFLETFANSLKYDIKDFAIKACNAKAPCDLGTRCTVFMNSKIKQSLRENASVEDISAGLSYSVVKNCLFKVLKLHDMSEMGDHIVLQGGTLKNPSIIRALELLTKRSVKCSKIPELMGAFGAALVGHKTFMEQPLLDSQFCSLNKLDEVEKYSTRPLTCKGCENNCRVTRFIFPNGKSFYSGNKCEKHFTSKGETQVPGFDFLEFKKDLIFNREGNVHEKPRLTIGIPQVLHFYENYVFWHTLFTHCGINVKVSSPSTVALAEKGMGTVMSDNICFPAKLVNGHIFDLAEKQVDRIFYPVVVYEKKECGNALNTFNCPIVSSYADVIESSINPEKRFGIPMDRPVINFDDMALVKRACYSYLKQFKIKKALVYRGIKKAFSAAEDVKEQLRNKAEKLIEKARQQNSLLIVLGSRPYHADGLVNHKLPDILTSLGADLITEDAIPMTADALDDVHVLTQWSYPNRIYNAARWVAEQKDQIQMVQINSFGCGPDAIVIDEVKEILKTGGKNHTLIKVDEISSPGSVLLRLRSMVESLEQNKNKVKPVKIDRHPVLKFLKKDSERKILVPFFAEDYSDFVPPLFQNAGYEFEILPKPDRESVDLGLQYANNDICYPGTIVIGDIIKALKTGNYRPDEIAVGITQTGGQCRASNYLSLIRKAMIKSGFEEIPIISVTASQGLIDQPGFRINWLAKVKLLLFTTMYADCLAKMYYSTAPREKIKGSSQKLRQYYMEKANNSIANNNYKNILRLLSKAIDDFNAVPVFNKDVPRMGIVGEIYAKYNYFANQNLVHWLIDQGVEPVVPPIIDFFIQDLVNYKVNIKTGIRHRRWTDLFGVYLEGRLNRYHRKINKLFAKFRYAVAFDDINHVAEKASDIMTMSNQFGEGWLVPGEIATFAGMGIDHVVSLQPFGCIANHIISKGVETRIKALYPKMNLHFLDFDPGMSEANVLNRLYFMIEHI